MWLEAFFVSFSLKKNMLHFKRYNFFPGDCFYLVNLLYILLCCLQLFSACVVGLSVVAILFIVVLVLVLFCSFLFFSNPAEQDQMLAFECRRNVNNDQFNLKRATGFNL